MVACWSKALKKAITLSQLWRRQISIQSIFDLNSKFELKLNKCVASETIFVYNVSLFYIFALLPSLTSLRPSLLVHITRWKPQKKEHEEVELFTFLRRNKRSHPMSSSSSSLSLVAQTIRSFLVTWRVSTFFLRFPFSNEISGSLRFFTFSSLLFSPWV